MSADSITLINAAISRSNGNTITSVDDGSPEAILASNNYEQVVEMALSSKPWRFARKKKACTLLPDAPIDLRWKYQWSLPSDVLVLRTILRNSNVDPEPDYEIDDANNVILCNYNTGLYAIYTYRAPEAVWASDFREGITQKMEALFLRLDSRAQEADDRDASADRMFQKSALIHSQEEAPHDKMRKLPLIIVRRAGNASRRC